MSNNFINDLVNAVQRILTPDTTQLEEVLIISGMPEKTQNLRYLSFNRHSIREEKRTVDFSAVAILNNRRIGQWRLAGYPKKISKVVFHPRWTRNPLDLFLNNLRCNPGIMDLLASAVSNYTLLGILETTEMQGARRPITAKVNVRPVVATPGITAEQLDVIEAYEKKNTLRSIGIPGLSLYRPVYS